MWQRIERGGGSWEHGNKRLDTIKCGEFLD